MKSFLKHTLFASTALALCCSSAMAAWTFNNGDLLLGIQATGGQGATTNVYFNLGSGVNFRDGLTPSTLGNINDDLVTAFGANWFDRTDLYFGVIGNLNMNPNSGPGSTGAVDGDPSRTFYVSRSTNSPGSSLAWTGMTSNQLGASGTNLNGQETFVRTLDTTASGAATSVNSGGNSWTDWNPVGNAAYTNFTGGIQDTFGQGGDINYIDIQRILSTNTGANPTGTPGTGFTEGTIAINRNGDISVVPEPSAALLGGLGLLALLRRRRSA